MRLAFLCRVRARFFQLRHGRREGAESLYVGGTAGLLQDLRGEELRGTSDCSRCSEARAPPNVPSRSLQPRRPFVRVGRKIDHPEPPQPFVVARPTGWRTRRPPVRSRCSGPRRTGLLQGRPSCRRPRNELSASSRQSRRRQTEGSSYPPKKNTARLLERAPLRAARECRATRTRRAIKKAFRGLA